MRKKLLFGIFILAGVFLHAQECDNYIELAGSGIAGSEEATLSLNGFEGVESVLVEAIFKSTAEPGDVRFWTGSQEVIVSPQAVNVSGLLGPEYNVAVYNAIFTDPDEEVHLDILENEPAFYSLAAYAQVKNTGMYSIMTGELYHVYKNEDDPFITEIEIPESEETRDIAIRFGITELNQDERWAVFTFEADGQEVSRSLQSWDPADETESYTIQEVMLEDVPGEVDKITMTMLSANEGGDSYIAGVVLVDLPCEKFESEVICSYTQGFYGNEGGKTCKGWTTRQLLEALLTDDPLVMGGGDNTFAIPATEDGGVQCVLDILPGGGPSAVLSGESSCSDMGSIETNKQGRLKNSLLAQGITLSLNLRLSPGLEDFPVDGETFMTWMAGDCINPVSEGVPGSGKEFAFSAAVVDRLGEGATVQDLLDLVNSALAGEDISPLNLSEVSDAATLVNEAFDECVVVKGSMEEEEMNAEESGMGAEGSRKGVLGISKEEAGRILDLYPNPVNDRFYLKIPARVTDVKSVGIYDMSGIMVMLIDQQIQTGRDQVIEVGVGQLNPGIYFIRIESGAGSVFKRFGIQ